MSQLTQPFSSRNAILALSLLHLRQRLLRLREQACAVHGHRDVSRHGDDGLDHGIGHFRPLSKTTPHLYWMHFCIEGLVSVGRL
jgi:hypothetical protein